MAPEVEYFDVAASISRIHERALTEFFRLYILMHTCLYRHPMALSIKDPETDRLARALSEATGESLTEAIRRALQERLARETQRNAHYRLETTVKRVQERLAALPVLDPRSPEELIGYDDHGLPG